MHKIGPFGLDFTGYLRRTGHGRLRPDQMMVQRVIAAAAAGVLGHLRVKRGLPPFSQGFRR